MGYWKIEPKYSSYAYRSKWLWWQFHKKARSKKSKFWYFSLGVTWYNHQNMLQFQLGFWEMNFIFPQKEGKIEPL